MHRRYRLSRSRDFDAVYRHGRSVSTRFLVLYWFPREDGEEPRLGIAVPKGTGAAPVRSKIKRQLREIWRSRLESLPPAQDYVLIVRPGLAEASEARGFDWLGERVDEVPRSRPRLSLSLHGRRALPGRLQVPPVLLAVRDRRPPALWTLSRCRPGRLAPPAL
jgi:ribonuclease P protein component